MNFLELIQMKRYLRPETVVSVILLNLHKGILFERKDKIENLYKRYLNKTVYSCDGLLIELFLY